MKKLLIPAAMLAMCAQTAFAGEYPLSGGKKGKPKKNFLREVPNVLVTGKADAEQAQDTVVPEAFKPTVQLGSIVHMYAAYEQGGFGPNTSNGSTDWGKAFNLYRARVLVGGQLSKNGSFFFETDLPTIIGTQNGSGVKNVEISQIVLDCQYEHKFAEAFQVIAGKQLVSHNRNGLQGAASLMANDFTFWQYPYNMFGNYGLMGNYGRDLGVNFRGLLANSKLEYRLGFFTGRNTDGKAPLRTVGRVVYNFLDPDKNFYYSGTNLGAGKTISLGAGVDAQATYMGYDVDLFVDVPITSAGSITFNGAFQLLNGGTNTTSKYSMATVIPKQTIQFGELGYYFKSLKLQPYLRYENRSLSVENEQNTTGLSNSDYDKLNSSTIFGGGLNYFFNGYGTNLRLSYTTFKKGVQATATAPIEEKTFGSMWLQLQFFLF